jgi:hypothetical protein
LLDATQFTTTGKWKGSITLSVNKLSKVTFGTGSSASISNTIAHTGVQSISVSGVAEYEQKRLLLTPGKKYFVSSWVSLNSNSLSTFQSASGLTGDNRLYLQVKYYDNLGNALSSYTSNFEPSGNIIEGWQKVEGEFTIPANAASIALRFCSGNNSNAYFDDVRISPTLSELKTYVYSNNNYRLKAVLDDNNYATFYYYDPKGNLFLVKKETERGVMTLQESYGHIKEH